jgi:hypothetical protein
MVGLQTTLMPIDCHDGVMLEVEVERIAVAAGKFRVLDHSRVYEQNMATCITDKTITGAGDVYLELRFPTRDRGQRVDERWSEGNKGKRRHDTYLGT